MNYREFLSVLDKKLKIYYTEHYKHVQCKLGCSACCEQGDYPLSQLELEYLMQGYISLDSQIKQIVQDNLRELRLGGVCPFLVNNRCSVYDFRPIVCRVHGLAYLCNKNIVKVPYCANIGKNYSKVYSEGSIEISPIKENLDTPSLLKDFNYGEIRNLFDWLK